MAEQAVVVGHPVERRRRQDRVDAGIGQRQRRHQVRHHELDLCRVARQALAGGLDHRGRAVERDDPARGEPLDQALGDPARPAAGVEDRLVAPQRQPGQDVRAPAGHRVGDAIVGDGVPVARGSSRVVVHRAILGHQRLLGHARFACSECALDARSGASASNFGGLLYAAAVPGPVALVGAGEFLAPMAEFDAGLLAATGRSRPRVVVLPTAAAPDGEATFQRWAEMGVNHFSALGAEVEPVLVRDVAEGYDAAALQAIGEADLVYLSGGHPRHLIDVLHGSPLGDAIRAANARGAVVAGCSAGAMAIVGRTVDFRFLPRVRMPMPFPVRWPQGLVARRRRRRAPALRRVARAVLRLRRAPGAARWRDPGHRRGHRRRRLQRLVAGPRARPRHDLARTTPRAVPQGRGVPPLGRRGSRRSACAGQTNAPGRTGGIDASIGVAARQNEAGRRGQSGRICRKQSLQ